MKPSTNQQMQVSNLPQIQEPLLSKISDTKILKSLGMLLLQAEDLRSITANSGPLTAANEYQVHYWFLNGRFTFKNNTYIDIAIPTVFYNYEQKVSGAAVDFELSAVDEMSEALEPVHNTKVNELMQNKPLLEGIEKIGAIFTEKIGPNQFTWISTNLGTKHKNP